MPCFGFGTKKVRRPRHYKKKTWLDRLAEDSLPLVESMTRELPHYIGSHRQAGPPALISKRKKGVLVVLTAR